MNVIKGDLLKITQGAIIHQVNCLGLWGAGLAAHLQSKFPTAFSDYKAYIRRHHDPVLCLGTICVTFESGVHVVSAFGQYAVGKGKQTEYGSLAGCFAAIADRRSQLPDVFIPSLIGCGLGGGDWKVVSKLIEYYLPYSTIVEYDK